MLACLFLCLACQTVPKVPPTVGELQKEFFSLKKSDLSFLRCDIESTTLKSLSPQEYRYGFKELFKREPTDEEISFLKNLKWQIEVQLLNQSVQLITSKPPTLQTEDTEKRFRQFLTIYSKLLTVVYLLNFTDRPDIRDITIEEKFFRVTAFDEKKIADVKWNFKEYSFEFGNEGQVTVETKPYNGSRVPSVMRLNFKNTAGRFETKFRTELGVPQLEILEATTPPTGRFIFRFQFSNCVYR